MKIPKKVKAEKQYCSEFKFTDKKSFKLCLSVLEQLWNQAFKTNKDPQLVLGMRRNDEEIFTVTGNLKIEKQKKI